jgi:hypothetical protein
VIAILFSSFILPGNHATPRQRNASISCSFISVSSVQFRCQFFCFPKRYVESAPISFANIPAFPRFNYSVATPSAFRNHGHKLQTGVHFKHRDAAVPAPAGARHTRSSRLYNVVSVVGVVVHSLFPAFCIY